MDLTGTWKAAPADEVLRRSFAEPGVDDEAWETVPVPGHWRSVPAFADANGPLLYRHRFEAPRPLPRERAWLVLDGLFYQGDVWLDGAYLGDTEGYFVRHTFEITAALAATQEHVLAVEVTCQPQDDRTSKRNITGVFQHWDCIDRDWNPGGIWRPVRIERTGPVRARSLRLLCREANASRAVVSLRAELDSDAARTVRLRTRVGSHEEVAERPVAEGSNFVEWTTTLSAPALWWPHALGDQPLHEVTVTVEADDAPSHVLRRRTGLRSLVWKQWTLSVNGERLFLKGANQGPSRAALGEATETELRRDVELAREAGLDLLRLHAHVSRPELYEAADELGMLLWQDFPLQWGYARGIRRQAARQAAAAVDLLGHHPSVALWCGHNEPIALDVGPGEGPTTRAAAAFLLGQSLPTWNKTVLDRSVKRAFEKADGTRPVVAHSGVLPHPGSVGTDTHLYFGWYHGDERDLPGFARAIPRMVRFVSEFGAQAVPEHDEFMGAEAWPDLDWDRLAHHHALQPEVMARHVPPAAFASYEAWKAATQTYQATLLKHHVETLRRLKYRPTGGFCQFAFADAQPAVTWSVLDHRRTPKAGYHALAAACRPVIVVADRPPETTAPGETVALDIHVVNDLRHAIPDATVTAVLGWPGGSHRWGWRGDVPADDCTRVGTVQAVVPDEPGSLTLDLTLQAGEIEATNHYASTVAAAPL